MLPILLVLAAFTLGGVALGISVIIARRERQNRDRRLALVSGADEKLAASGEASTAWLGERLTKLDAGLKALLTLGEGYRWGMRASSPLLAMIAVACAGMTWLIVGRGLGTSTLLTAPLCLFAAFLGPRVVLLREQGRAERRFTDYFPDAVDMVARMLRAGMPITAAMRTVGAEAPPPVNQVFTMIADQTRIGIPVADALDIASQRIALPDFRFFSVAVIIQHATGGNLVSTLDVLAQVMRKRRAMRLKAKAVTAEVRFSAYVLGALPFLVVTALLIVQPDYLTPLFQDRRGQMILGAAGAALMLSFITMRQMTRSVSRD